MNGLTKHATRFMLAAATLAFIWSYLPTVSRCVTEWLNEPEYSHGFLVPLVAGWMLWLRREKLAGSSLGIYPSGIVWLLAAALVRIAGTYLYIDWLDGISFILGLFGLCSLAFGASAARWAWPGLTFLLFMLPLPYRLETALARPLQTLATKASTYGLQTLGFAAVAEGNIIIMEHAQLGVARACSGLSMLFAFFALSYATAFFIGKSTWERVVLVASAIPIAIVTNVLRITITGICHEWFGPEIADMIFHDLAGWLMMPIGLVFLGMEVALLRALILPPKDQRPTLRVNAAQAASAASNGKSGKVSAAATAPTAR